MKERLRRVSIRMPSFAREDLKAVRGLLAAHKLERNDGWPVSQEQAVALCIRFAYEKLVAMSGEEFVATIAPKNKFVMDVFEKEGE